MKEGRPQIPQNAEDIANTFAGLDKNGREPQIRTTQTGTITLTDDPAVGAKWMLATLSAIAAFDNGATSHLVTGFIKYAFGL